jgi:hypothetical protein
VKSDATISPCGVYRYHLERIWDESLPLCCWVMLNPSIADATKDDPTIRRCIGFAKSWGYGGIVVVNLFALRATDPIDIYFHPFPEGPDISEHLVKWTTTCKLVVAGWGVHGSYRDRHKVVAGLLECRGVKLHSLALTKDGQPKHPLYLKSTLQPVAWSPPSKEPS